MAQHPANNRAKYRARHRKSGHLTARTLTFVATAAVVSTAALVVSGSADPIPAAPVRAAFDLDQTPTEAPQVEPPALTRSLDGAVADALADREPRVSRSTERAGLRMYDVLTRATRGERPEPEPTDPRDIARAMLPEFGFSDSEFGCLDALYVSESNWEVTADNPTSTAYGIPQALMSAHVLPKGYMTSAEVQIRWGLGYIRDAYGTPCAAWSFKQGNGWY